MKINISGVVVPNDYKWIYSICDIQSFCPNDLNLKDINEEIEVEINSPGGYVDAGAEIYSRLKQHGGKVVTIINSKAYSIASIIAMAGDVVKISPIADIMIHNATASCISGDYKDMSKASEILKETNERLANAYVLKTGISKDEILNMMNYETFLSPEEAKAKNFVDEILFSQEQIKMVASMANEIIPQKIINKMMLEKQNLTEKINKL